MLNTAKAAPEPIFGFLSRTRREGAWGELPMLLTGGCFCGLVRYEIRAPLSAARSCHCSRCRKAFSGASSAYAQVERGAFAWVAGETAIARYESSPGWGWCFCARCGSTLCGTHEGEIPGVAPGSIGGDAPQLEAGPA